VTIAVHQAIFAVSVVHIVLMRAGEQVRWVAAGPIVAFMANIKRGGERTVSEFPRDAMGGPGASFDLNLAIAAGPDVAGPRPTRIRAGASIDVRPESLFKRDRASARDATKRSVVISHFARVTKKHQTTTGAGEFAGRLALGMITLFHLMTSYIGRWGGSMPAAVSAARRLFVPSNYTKNPHFIGRFAR
jgi:hypothetical protein